MRGLAYKRILVKLSGEILATPSRSIDPKKLALVVHELKRVRALGAEVAVVVGGGNLWRKREQGRGMDGRAADYLGLLSTVMNGYMLAAALRKAGQPCILQSPLAADVPGIDMVDLTRARGSLRRGEVVIFAAGTGQVGFTTDTAAAERGAQVKADVIVKLSQVDGVYSADPKKSKYATKYSTLTMYEALKKELGVMDKQAFQICAKAKVPIVVCKWGLGVIARVVRGEQVGTLVTP